MPIYVHHILIQDIFINQYNLIRCFVGIKRRIDLELINGRFIKCFLKNDFIHIFFLSYLFVYIYLFIKLNKINY
jgi:hypothetical protein